MRTASAPSEGRLAGRRPADAPPTPADALAAGGAADAPPTPADALAAGGAADAPPTPRRRPADALF
jgi:hypothetical protein